MTANLKTTELVDAAITLLNALTFARVPKIIQEGDLWFYVENDTLSNDLPAYFVKATDVRIFAGDEDQDLSDITGAIIGTSTRIRIVLVTTWDHGDEVVDTRQLEVQEIAQGFIRGAGDPFNMNAAIAGYTITRAVPVSMELEPPESALVSIDEERQLYAVAVNLLVEGFSTRS